MKLNILPAATGLYHHSYSPISVGSLDFGELACGLCVESVPKDDWTKFSGRGLIRLAPQIFPPYGRAFIKTAAFFVPESQLFEDALSFHNNQAQYLTSTVKMPHFSSYDLLGLFSDIAYSSSVATSVNPTTDSNWPSLASYDFVSFTANNLYDARRLNTLGRRYFKLLKSLGYDFPSISYNSVAATAKGTATYDLNALKLLAYAKVYSDFFLSGESYNNSPLVGLLHAIHSKHDYTIAGSTVYTASTGVLTAIGIEYLLKNMLLPHEQNMYLSAWNDTGSATGVNPASETIISNPSGLMSPVQENGETFGINTTGQFVNGNTNNTKPQFTAYGLRFFQAFANFVMRGQLSGSKPVQRFFSNLGIKAPEFNENFAHKLYEGSDRIQFSPVVSNTKNTLAGTSESTGLGDYAGFGVSGLNFDFNYKSSQYGYIIVLHWIQVVPIIVRGFDPSVMRMYPADWWTAQFDGNAFRAIPLCEIARNNKCNDGSGIKDTAVFGFTNLYDDMRSMRDNVYGDFCFGNTKNFVIARDYSVIRQSQIALKPQYDVVKYYDQIDNADLTNPFQTDVTNGDRFYLEVEYDIEAQRPIKTNSDALSTYLGGTGDLSINKNGDLMS